MSTFSRWAAQLHFGQLVLFTLVMGVLTFVVGILSLDFVGPRTKGGWPAMTALIPPLALIVVVLRSWWAWFGARR